MDYFIRSFWLTSVAVALGLAGVIHLEWSEPYGKLPPRPPLWLGQGPAFVAQYSSHGSTTHYLNRFGLFGVRERLRHSDVLLMGSSHVECGLSAGLLSRKLSELMGRPVRVYNMAMSCGDGIGFAQKSLDYNNVKNKAVIFDLFSPNQDKLSDYARVVNQSNSLDAYLKVYDIWLKYSLDWCLDPILPRFDFTAPDSAFAIGPGRFLGSVTTHDWDTGDLVEGWSPARGCVYGHPEPGVAQPLGNGNILENVPNGAMNLTPASTAYFSMNKLVPVYTFIPFEGSEKAVPPAEAKPFVPIAREDLQSFDQSHLTGPSRDMATVRLFDGIKSSGLAAHLLSGSSPR